MNHKGFTFLHILAGCAVLVLVLAIFFNRPVKWAEQIGQKPVQEGFAPKPMTLLRVDNVKIPQEVYDGIATNSKYQEIITGSKKQVVVVIFTGCPYARAFKQELNRLFAQGDFSNYYDKTVIDVGRTSWVNCHNETGKCPTSWIFDVCGSGICIVNPAQRKAVVDASQNARQIGTLLEHYKNW